MDSNKVLTFLGALQDARELVYGLSRYCNNDGLLALDSAVGRMQPSMTNAEEITSNMLLIAMLCSTQRVSTTLLGAPYLDERHLLPALAISTIQNVLEARYLCLTALQASLSPDNCFRLFRFADQCGISPLRAAAEQICLACLPHSNSPTSDDGGFSLLLPDQLQHLLQSDLLQVSNELSVFHAIATWASAAPQDRSPLVALLVQRCMRLGAMDLAQLEELDQDPRVVANGEVTRLVAHAYVTKCLSGGTRSSVQRPRDSMLRAVAAAMVTQAKAVMEVEEKDMVEAWEGLKASQDGSFWVSVAV